MCRPRSRGRGEVSIRVAAVALNFFFDTLIVRGKYQTKPDLPFSPGGELAGKVVRLGPGVEGLSPGQRVLAYTGYNGCREEAIAPANRVVALPDGVSDEVAVCIPIAYGTALHGLEDRGHLWPETVPCWRHGWSGARCGGGRRLSRRGGGSGRHVGRKAESVRGARLPPMF